jgi:hypothetical protein
MATLAQGGRISIGIVEERNGPNRCAHAAQPQANPRDTEVRVLHVLEPIYTHGYNLGYIPEASQILEEEREKAKGLLARASQKLCDKGFTVTTALEEGNPKVVIVDSATEWDADLIERRIDNRNRFFRSVTFVTTSQRIQSSGHLYCQAAHIAAVISVTAP